MSAIHFRIRYNKMCMRFFLVFPFISLLSNSIQMDSHSPNRILNGFWWAVLSALAHTDFSIRQTNKREFQRCKGNTRKKRHEPFFYFQSTGGDCEIVFIVSLKFRKISESNKKKPKIYAIICIYFHCCAFTYMKSIFKLISMVIFVFVLM